jgi:hypothetical protein
MALCKKRMSQNTSSLLFSLRQAVDKTEFLVVEGAKWSELFPIKLTVRKLPLAYNFIQRQTPTIPRNYVSKLQDNLDM